MYIFSFAFAILATILIGTDQYVLQLLGSLLYCLAGLSFIIIKQLNDDQFPHERLEEDVSKKKDLY